MYKGCPTFNSMPYKNASIQTKVEGGVETVRIVWADPGNAPWTRDVVSVRAAKCLITRRLNK